MAETVKAKIHGVEITPESMERAARKALSLARTLGNAVAELTLLFKETLTWETNQRAARKWLEAGDFELAVEMLVTQGIITGILLAQEARDEDEQKHATVN